MKTIFRDLGLMPYQQAWDYQESLLNEIITQKLENYKQPLNDERLTNNYLLFVEHPHVFTLGKSGSEDNMLANFIQLQAKNAEFIHTNRGGDITYHGPGQIVGYPILILPKVYVIILKNWKKRLFFVCNIMALKVIVWKAQPVFGLTRMFRGKPGRSVLLAFALAVV
jgi:lipoate-protein ligase B